MYMCDVHVLCACQVQCGICTKILLEACIHKLPPPSASPSAYTCSLEIRLFEKTCYFCKVSRWGRRGVVLYGTNMFKLTLKYMYMYSVYIFDVCIRVIINYLHKSLGKIKN